MVVGVKDRRGAQDVRVHMQVPFLKVANMGGRPVQNAVTAAAKPFASMLLGASGAQFFLHDSVDGQAPLLVSRHRLLLSLISACLPAPTMLQTPVSITSDSLLQYGPSGRPQTISTL